MNKRYRCLGNELQVTILHVTLLLLLAWLSVPVLSYGDEQVIDPDENDALLPFNWFVAGTVEDEQGNRVSGAFVTALVEPDRTVTTTSEANGQFLLKFRGKSRYGFPILIHVPDGSEAASIGRFTFTNETRKLFRVVLKPVRVVRAHVQDDSGQPIPNAVIDVMADYRVIQSGTSDKNGQATLKFPADASVDWITARHDDFGFDYYENYDAWPTKSRLTPPEDLPLTLNGSRSVTINVVDSQDQPVPGVAVVPWIVQKDGKLSHANLSGSPASLHASDENGIAEIGWIPRDLARSVSFVMRHSKYHCPQFPTLESDQDRLTVRVQRVATVRGTSTYSNGQPAAGIRIQGEGRGDATRYFRRFTRTKDDGTYELDIYPDQSTIIATLETAFAAKSQTGIVLKEGQTREGVDLVIDDGTIIRGRVTMGHERKPAEGEAVTLIQHAAGADLVRWSETDDEGNYKFCVGPGTFTLHLPGDLAQGISFTVTDQQELVNNGHLSFKPRTTLSGKTIDQSGQLLPNCDIYGESIDAPNHAGFKSRSNADGRFTTERWSDEMVIYARNADRNFAGHKQIAPDDTEVTVELKPAARVTGVVRDQNGQPAKFLRVVVYLRIEGTLGSINMTSRTAEDGQYEFSGIAPNTAFSVFAWRDSENFESENFNVQTTDPIELDDIVIDSAPPQ